MQMNPHWKRLVAFLFWDGLAERFEENTSTRFLRFALNK